MAQQVAPGPWIPEDTFGDRLRRVRRSLGLTQEEFAGRLGGSVGIKALGAWETGTREPRGAVGIAKRIELAFGVPATWLLGLETPGPVGPPGPGRNMDTGEVVSWPRAA